jgi:hypothetical protein
MNVLFALLHDGYRGNQGQAAKHEYLTCKPPLLTRKACYYSIEREQKDSPGGTNGSRDRRC